MWIGGLTSFNTSEHLESCVELVLDKEVKGKLLFNLSLPPLVDLVVLSNQILSDTVHRHNPQCVHTYIPVCTTMHADISSRRRGKAEVLRSEILPSDLCKSVIWAITHCHA